MLIQSRAVLRAINDMANGFFAWLPKLAVGAAVFFLFWILAAAVRSGVQTAAEKAGKTGGVSQVLARLARWGVLFAGVLMALSFMAPSLDAASLIQLLGVSGVAIGFAFRDILQNFLAGILILLNEPFRVGDQIVFGSYEGTVEGVETRATTLKTYDGRQVVIPNGKLYTDAVIVNTAYDLRRTEYDFGIGYGDDVQLATRLLEETLAEVDGIVDDPAPQVLTWELAASSVNLRARWWTRPSQASLVEVRDRVIERAKEKFDAHEDVDFPFTIRDVRITEDVRAGG